MLISLFFTLFCISVISPVAQSETLVIYEHVGRQGESLQVTVEGCTPFPVQQAWNDRVSSVNNNGACITLHENRDCTGKFIDLLPGDANQFDLYTAKFDDMASSASPCNRDYRGAYVEEGTYYIESAEDESALTTEEQVAGSIISRVVLTDAVDSINQKWRIAREKDSSKLNGYTITSEVLTSNPITMNVRAAKPTKNTWHFLPGIGGKYMIYYPTPVGGNICLVNRGYGNAVGQTFCENNARNQQWVLRKTDSAMYRSLEQPAAAHASNPRKRISK